MTLWHNRFEGAGGPGRGKLSGKCVGYSKASRPDTVANLVDSTVSTRALFGNYKHRPPFPALRPFTPSPGAELDPAVHGADHLTTCSVCDGPFTDGLHQVWLTRGVGTDALPLLVNACSQACVEALPPGRQNYVATPHHGGPEVVQPATGR
ncbi:hypothetical protein JIG36_00660 [Actinoplanes sp. LDG1-06]|uniref:Uncharacterized protein n=1 Tax=Paractinoplanes ovalisporus TaxID=2810368 RepID=A0ABS2A2K6_9ACTN|nr:hypothetical protein [Actinoplanes ovalisporus]MBM2614065.1 hypothetical protein [Actinoplanes ovalisporus]